MKAGTPKWSASDELLLIDLWAAGWTDKALSDVFGRSAPAIGRKRGDMGACRTQQRPPQSDMHRRCVAMRKNFTASQIAHQLGITRNAVIGHWHRHDTLKARVNLAA